MTIRRRGPTLSTMDDTARDDMDPRETARTRRRDRDLDHSKDLLRPGLAKGLKQVAEAQAKRDRELLERRAAPGKTDRRDDRS